MYLLVFAVFLKKPN